MRAMVLNGTKMACYDQIKGYIKDAGVVPKGLLTDFTSAFSSGFFMACTGESCAALVEPSLQLHVPSFCFCTSNLRAAAVFLLLPSRSRICPAGLDHLPSSVTRAASRFPLSVAHLQWRPLTWCARG